MPKWSPSCSLQYVGESHRGAHDAAHPAQARCAGPLPHSELEINCRDCTTQCVPRSGRDSRDSIRTEWEASIVASSTLQHWNPEHCAHHHLTVRPVSSLICAISISCLPAQHKQRALVALAAAASSDIQAHSLSDPPCTSRLRALPVQHPAPTLFTMALGGPGTRQYAGDSMQMRLKDRRQEAGDERQETGHRTQQAAGRMMHSGGRKQMIEGRRRKACGMRQLTGA